MPPTPAKALIGASTLQDWSVTLKTAAARSCLLHYILTTQTDSRLALQAFDTAVCYKNEESVGQALGQYLRAGKVKRTDLFITTKLWSHQHAKESVEPAVRESLQKIQLDYLDLLLIHWPMTDQNGSELQPTSQVPSILLHDFESPTMYLHSYLHGNACKWFAKFMNNPS